MLRKTVRNTDYCTIQQTTLRNWIRVWLLHNTAICTNCCTTQEETLRNSTRVWLLHKYSNRHQLLHYTARDTAKYSKRLTAARYSKKTPTAAQYSKRNQMLHNVLSIYVRGRECDLFFGCICCYFLFDFLLALIICMYDEGMENVSLA